MSFGDQAALFVVDVVRRVVEVVETVARAGLLHAFAERVGFVADGVRAHALIDQARESVARVISERPVGVVAALRRKIAVGGVSVLQSFAPRDALQHVRGRSVCVSVRARARSPVGILRDGLREAVAVRIVSETLVAVRARRAGRARPSHAFYELRVLQ